MVEVKWVVGRKSTQGVGSVGREEDEREGRIETCGWQKHRVGWREGGYISQSGALCRGGSSVDVNSVSPPLSIPANPPPTHQTPQTPLSRSTYSRSVSVWHSARVFVFSDIATRGREREGGEGGREGERKRGRERNSNSSGVEYNQDLAKASRRPRW